MSINTEHAADWDAQRETLSAYLDGRLPSEDADSLRRHLRTCSRCAEELAELRQVVLLLRALPRPALPRSFTLPLAEPAAPAQPQPLVHPARSGRRPTAWPRVAQWAGGLVAAAGLIIGIAGSVGQFPSLSQHAATSAAGALAPRRDDRVTSGASPAAGQAATPAYAANDATNAPALSGTPAVVLVPTPTPNPQQTGITSMVPVNSAPGLPTLPIAGATLLVAGATTFAAGTRARRRGR
jgi:anti-sigma factor RsiW